jgi:dTDP-4-dehydrorhamnose reductase
MLKLAKTHNSINVVSDQIGSPTYTLDLANAINELIKEPNYGIYHLTNSNICSWYEFALEIFKNAGIEITVNPVTTEEYGSPAPRPKYSVLDNYNWKIHGHEKLRNYSDALKAFMDTLD